MDKNDEFYTLLPDVEKELQHYDFTGKIVYCPCDTSESAFVTYFVTNFKKLKLKKLIATAWNGESFSKQLGIVNLFTTSEFRPFSKVEMIEGSDTLKITYPLGTGDFRSDICKELMRECDVVVTNPPFSLFRDLVSQIMELKKDFILLGNNNALICKEIFPLIQQNKIKLGNGTNLIMQFKQPDGSLGTVHGISWFTTLDYKITKKPLILKEKYSPENYPTYVNYPAIEVDKLSKIPKDYLGEMGVPITYLGKHDSTLFEITGLGRGQSNPLIKRLGPSFVANYNAQDPDKRNVSPDCTGNLGYWKDGKAIIPYMRILIKRKETANE